MEYVFLIVILIFSVVIHELSHGAMANYLGDPTAKNEGRLTLNPLKHLDPIGSVILPIFLVLMSQLTGGGIIFGWAKPVPINPYNFRDQKYGSAKTALAGPASNLLIALIFGLALRFFPQILFVSGLGLMFSYIIYINILLAVFNLLPIPPLDGSHILFTFLPRSFLTLKMFLSQFGFFFLLIVIFFLFPLLRFVVNAVFGLIVGFPLF
ncbi:MAG: site-2 protease family protein [bacterium]